MVYGQWITKEEELMLVFSIYDQWISKEKELVFAFSFAELQICFWVKFSLSIVSGPWHLKPWALVSLLLNVNRTNNYWKMALRSVPVHNENTAVSQFIGIIGAVWMVSYGLGISGLLWQLLDWVLSHLRFKCFGCLVLAYLCSKNWQYIAPSPLLISPNWFYLSCTQDSLVRAPPVTRRLGEGEAWSPPKTEEEEVRCC